MQWHRYARLDWTSTEACTVASKCGRGRPGEGAGAQVLEAPLEPILQQVTRWLNLFEARSLPRPQPNSTDGAGSSMTSGWLAPDGSDLRPPPRRSSGAGARCCFLPPARGSQSYSPGVQTLQALLRLRADRSGTARSCLTYILLCIHNAST